MMIFLLYLLIPASVQACGGFGLHWLGFWSARLFWLANKSNQERRLCRWFQFGLLLLKMDVVLFSLHPKTITTPSTDPIFSLSISTPAAISLLLKDMSIPVTVPYYTSTLGTDPYCFKDTSTPAFIPFVYYHSQPGTPTPIKILK